MNEHDDNLGAPAEDGRHALRSKSSPETGSGLSASIVGAATAQEGSRIWMCPASGTFRLRGDFTITFKQGDTIVIHELL